MSHGVQLSGNEMLNRKVLSSRWKVRSDETVRRETGRVFHARAAATGNARSPILCIGMHCRMKINGHKYSAVGKCDATDGSACQT